MWRHFMWVVLIALMLSVCGLPLGYAIIASVIGYAALLLAMLTAIVLVAGLAIIAAATR